MMIHLCVLSSFISLCYGQNAVLSYQDDCHKVGDTLTIIAVYTGTGTPQPMAWTYSGSSLTIDTDTCLPFGGVPQNFPNESRLSYDCVTTDSTLPPDTYQLKVSRLQDNELNETWGATFTPPGGIAPGAVQLAIPRNCDGTTVPPTASTTPPPTSSTTTKSPDITVVIIVPSVVVVILIICIIVCILLRKKSNRKKKYRADSENKEMSEVDINVTKQQ